MKVRANRQGKGYDVIDKGQIIAIVPTSEEALTMMGMAIEEDDPASGQYQPRADENHDPFELFNEFFESSTCTPNATLDDPDPFGLGEDLNVFQEDPA